MSVVEGTGGAARMTLWDPREREVAAPPTPKAPSPENPPRIPVADQRLIRLLAFAALVGAAACVVAALTVDPIADPVAGLGASLLLGAVVGVALAPILLIESYRRHPGQWRGRRTRALRRGFLVGAVVGGYSAFRVAGLGSPSGLLIAAALAGVIEAALTRADNDAV